MPLNDTGKKVKEKFHEEYGEKEGDRIMYSKENKDKKFKQAITGAKKKSSAWWANRISKLPEMAKHSLLSTIDHSSDVDWWLRTIDIMRAMQPRPVDRSFGDKPNIPRDLDKSEK